MPKPLLEAESEVCKEEHEAAMFFYPKFASSSRSSAVMYSAVLPTVKSTIGKRMSCDRYGWA